MKTLPRLSALVLPAALAVLLGACATSNNEQRMEHRANTGGSMPMHQSGMGSMGASGSADDVNDADVRAMCESNRQMMNARTPEERWALMEEPFRAMTPEMRERHLQLMRERCGATR